MFSLPSTLATAVKAAEDLENRIARTRAALATAIDRAERAGSEYAQAQVENDALAAERDLAHAAMAMGETPDQDVASLDKQLATLAKRLAAGRTEREAANGAERGLTLRLSREVAERTDVLAQIEAGQADARIALQSAGTAVFDKVADLLTKELGPICAAEAAINGDAVASELRKIILDHRGPNLPVRHYEVVERCRQTAAPADFARAGQVARRMSHSTSSPEA